MRTWRSRYPTILPPDKVKLPVPVKRESFDVERPGILLSSEEWAKAGTVHKVPLRKKKAMPGEVDPELRAAENPFFLRWNYKVCV
jgi:hypothetical protein